MIDRIITITARHQVTAGLETDPQAVSFSRGVIAGVVAASQALLTPTEFSRFVAACEIDQVALSEFIEIAEAEPAEQPAIDV